MYDLNNLVIRVKKLMVEFLILMMNSIIYFTCCYFPLL